MPLTPKEMESAVINNMLLKTGKTLEQWVVLTGAEAPVEKKARLAWLKDVHHLGHIQSTIIISVLETGKSTYANVNSLMDNLFAGDNSSTRLLYQLVRNFVASLGADVKVSVNRTYISFSRQRLFLILKPTKGIMILGLALPEGTKNERLTRARFLGTPPRINLQVSLREMSEIDGDLKFLIKKAYEGS